MKFPILVLFAAAAISSPALAQGGGDAGDGNAGSRANYDYSYRFPGDLPQPDHDASYGQTEPTPRAHRSHRARH